MKIHILTIGQPKLAYAAAGWREYTKRLERFHQLRITHLADKYANNSAEILKAFGNGTVVALEVQGKQYSSEHLAAYLDHKALDGREMCFVIGGPNGLPPEVRSAAQSLWSLSELTMPHDLAMVVVAEALYRASTISAGLPYHRG